MVLVPPAAVNINCSYPIAEYYSDSFKTCPLVAGTRVLCRFHYFCFPKSYYSRSSKEHLFGQCHFIIMLIRKKSFWAWATVCEVCRFSHVLVLRFAPTPQPCAHEENWHVWVIPAE